MDSVRAIPLKLAGLARADPDTHVFAASDGGLLRQDNWRRRVWMPALEVAGLGNATPRPGFHDLRRAVGTSLTGLGVDPKTTQHRLGHSDIRTTLQIYARALDSNDQDAAEQLATRYMGTNDEPSPRSAPDDTDEFATRLQSTPDLGRSSGGERTRTADFYVAKL